MIPAGVAQTFYGQETWSCDYKQHEESAVHLPAHKFEKAKMISVEDSIEIQRRQKEEIEVSRAVGMIMFLHNVNTLKHQIQLHNLL